MKIITHLAIAALGLVPSILLGSVDYTNNTAAPVTITVSETIRTDSRTEKETSYLGVKEEYYSSVLDGDMSYTYTEDSSRTSSRDVTDEPGEPAASTTNYTINPGDRLVLTDSTSDTLEGYSCQWAYDEWSGWTCERFDELGHWEVNTGKLDMRTETWNYNTNIVSYSIE